MQKINREDMLELTGRMTVKRNCFHSIAGTCLDADGFIDGTFNIHFQKMSLPDQETTNREMPDSASCSRPSPITAAICICLPDREDSGNL